MLYNTTFMYTLIEFLMYMWCEFKNIPVVYIEQKNSFVHIGANDCVHFHDRVVGITFLLYMYMYI